MKPLKATIEVELTIRIEPQSYDWDLIEEYDTLSDGLIGVAQRELGRLQGLNDLQIDVTQAVVHIDDYGATTPSLSSVRVARGSIITKEAWNIFTSVRS
jgi:hypothetical protein